jgi:hypothetical protein
MKAVPAVCALLLLSGCSGRSTTDSEQSARSGNQGTSADLCHQPLSVYCQEVGCRNYARSLAAACRSGSSRSRMATWEVGECGGLRFTRFEYGFGSNTEYFDASGKLVAAFTTTDNVSPNSACPRSKSYGQPIDCKPVQVMDACRSSAQRQPRRGAR